MLSVCPISRGLHRNSTCQAMFFLSEGARPEKPDPVTKKLGLMCSFGLLLVPGLLLKSRTWFGHKYSSYVPLVRTLAFPASKAPHRYFTQEKNASE